MSTPFADPANPVSIDFKDIHGALLLIEVTGHEDDVPNVNSVPGVKSPAVRANVTVLDGPHTGRIYEDALIFPKAMQGQLRSRMGKLVLGRLGQGEKQPGKNAPWRLDTATDADRRVAQTYVNSTAGGQHAPQPAAQSAGYAPAPQQWPGATTQGTLPPPPDEPPF
jgi:hypothetical protein